MSWVALAIVGGSVGAAAISRKGGDGGGGGFQAPPESEEAKKARKRLLELAEGPPPEVPLRKIAPLPAVTEERKIARETAKELIQPQDFMALPEVQAIIEEASVRGDILANRLGRGLQKTGAFTTTPGRDILGRSVADVERGITSALAPFAAEERARRERLIPMLETLGLTEEERERIFEQAGLTAAFEKEFAESEQLQTFTIPLLQSIIGLQPGVQPIIPSQQPSFLGQISPLLGQIGSALINRPPTPGPTIQGAAQMGLNWINQPLS